MSLPLNNVLFKKIMILFWTLWWIIALLTDVVGGLVHLGWLHAAWAQDSNYPFLVETLAMYSVPAWLPAYLYVGIILWMFIISVAFLWACLALPKQTPAIWMCRAQKAFIISLCLWLTFFLADQIVLKFDLEENHMVQGGFQLLSYLALFVLPDE